MNPVRPVWFYTYVLNSRKEASVVRENEEKMIYVGRDKNRGKLKYGVKKNEFIISKVAASRG